MIQVAGRQLDNIPHNQHWQQYLQYNYINSLTSSKTSTYTTIR